MSIHDYFQCTVTVHIKTYTSTGILFNDSAPTDIYTLSLHDALPICVCQIDPRNALKLFGGRVDGEPSNQRKHAPSLRWRSEEHTSELQSRQYLVCRLLLEKKKKKH